MTQHDTERYARRIVRISRAAEFRTFWIGTHYPKDAEPDADTRRELNRAVGLRVLELLADKEATPLGPEARFTLHVPSGRVETYLLPLLVYGRYLKYSRSIPQSKWPCTRCRGPACPRCGGTGKLYAWSVEEIVAEPIMARTGGRRTKLHSVGREDVDARMLGRGRPFVIEIRRPLRRHADLADAQRLINERWREEVGVREMRIADHRLAARVCRAQPDKRYRALCEADAPVDLARLQGIRDLTLSQDTPVRVMHRRSNRTRTRRVYSLSASAERDARRFRIETLVQSGTYVKEFISGDGDRTRPSISQMLGVPSRCLELDVMDVLWDPPEA